MSATYTDLTNTNFPDATDTMTRVSDASYAYKDLITQYYAYKNAGNDVAAVQMLVDNPALNTMILNAEKINKFLDACIALQRWYGDDIKPFFEDRFSNKGEYNSGTTYLQGNVISYNGEGFICRVTSSIGVFPTAHINNTNWAIIAKQGDQGESGTGLLPRGIWNNATTYYVDDCISHNNILWQCLVENTNSEPNSGNTNWSMLVYYFMPQIKISVDSGATVTAQSGTTIITGTSSDGLCTLNIPKYGEWEINAILGETAAIPLSVTIDTVKQYSATLVMIDTVLNNNSWESISQMSSTASNYWDVGDVKAISMSGTIGTQSISGTYYVYILGFNHNSSIEGSGIHFGGFKTSSSGGTDICFVDGNYGVVSDKGTKYFSINHSSATNSGGWQNCDMRYDILGSVNSKGTQNASPTTATSPVSNTLMSALPSSLRAVMKPMTKYSDNTGGGVDTAAYVTSTIDYLPLLAEYEIFGYSAQANSAEKNYQAQYSYYINGNSKIKYKYNNTGTAVYYFERSSRKNYDYEFGCVSTSGTVDATSVACSYGVSPIFKV